MSKYNHIPDAKDKEAVKPADKEANKPKEATPTKPGFLSSLFGSKPSTESTSLKNNKFGYGSHDE